MTFSQAIVAISATIFAITKVAEAVTVEYRKDIITNHDINAATISWWTTALNYIEMFCIKMNKRSRVLMAVFTFFAVIEMCYNNLMYGP